MPDSAAIAANLAVIRKQIAVAAQAAGRGDNSVRLIAVSKTQNADAVAAAYAAGQRDFGENKVQEAQGKFTEFKLQHPDVRLHLIGPLQSNKTAAAVKLFDVIASLDRPKLAHELAKEMQKQGRRVELLIEINIGAEPQKAGIIPDGLPDFLRLCRDELKLPVRGLMCIPPMGDNPAPYFQKLAQLADAHDLPERSMGMSGDYVAAIKCGATEVRVGTAIFGERQK